mmetsp:Transcript_29780/g.74907  ORF Transcript_29780/g.74907 Transcript_29780/m.74907 type:complete len:427 (-) Transcript_29780:157-1437(-)
MAWSDLEASRTKLHVHIVVSNDGDLSVLRGHNHRLAHEVLVALVVGVDADSSVAEDGLWARGGDREELVLLAALDGVLEVVELALLLRVLDLEIRNCRLEVGAPVDHILPPIHQTLVMELHERLSRRLGQPLVHREALTRPVGGGAEAPQLLGDVAPLFALPLPHLFQKLFATNVVPAYAFGVEAPLHQQLRRDPRVVRAGEPQGGPPPHAVKPGHDVLEGDKHGVAHVQPPGDVGGGHREHVAALLPLLVLGGFEVSRLLPPLIDGLLDGARVVLGGHVALGHGVGGAGHAPEASQGGGVPAPPQVKPLEGEPGENPGLCRGEAGGGGAAGEEGGGGGGGGEAPAEAEVGGGGGRGWGGEGAVEVRDAPDAAGVGPDAPVGDVCGERGVGGDEVGGEGEDLGALGGGESACGGTSPMGGEGKEHA